MPAFLRRNPALFILAGLTLVALALRTYALDAIPTPSGDEGNWTWIAFDLVHHRPATLPPDARFVSLAFARLIAMAYGLFGFNFAAARSVCVAGILVAMWLSYTACASLDLRRAGISIAALLAVHPWSLLWSRTVTVPYALSLALGTAGPLCLLAAIYTPHRGRQRVGLLVSFQLLFAGLHFSPLGVIPLASAVLYVLARPRTRVLLRTPWPWAAFVLGFVHALAVLPGALRVATRGATRPDHQFDRLGVRLYTYGRTVLDGLPGEATLRHFTGDTLPPVLESLALLSCIGLIVASLRVRIPVGEPGLLSELRRLSLTYFSLSLIALPCILAPMRPWNLPAIDAERYLFAILAPFFLVVGSLAASPSRAGRIATHAFVIYLFLGPSARAARDFTLGGSPDAGFWLRTNGGGYRGWKVARERVAIPWLIRDEVDRVAHREPATILVADYAFHTLHFANSDTPYPTVDVTKFEPEFLEGRRYFFVLWSRGLFAPDFDVPRAPAANASLRERMCTRFDDVRKLRAFVQPDGAPLIELWTAVFHAHAVPSNPAMVVGCEDRDAEATGRTEVEVW